MLDEFEVKFNSITHWSSVTLRKSGPAIRYMFTTAKQRSRPRYRAEQGTIVALSTSHTHEGHVTCLSIILENTAGIGRKSGKTITEMSWHCGELDEIRNSDNNRRVVGFCLLKKIVSSRICVFRHLSFAVCNNKVNS